MLRAPLRRSSFRHAALRRRLSVRVLDGGLSTQLENHHGVDLAERPKLWAAGLLADATGRPNRPSTSCVSADAQAAKIYADSFGKDPKFYDFWRAMQSYRHTFGVDGTNPEGKTNIILSPDNEYLKEFVGE